MITFSQLNIGDPVYVLEVAGTFKKSTNFYIGTIVNMSKVYDEPLNPQQFTMPNNPRRKLIDITISCNGEHKKITVDENKTIIVDNLIGLTISTDKQQMITIIKNTYNEYKAKKESLMKYEQELTKYEDILRQLEQPIQKEEDSKLIDLQKQIEELKRLLNTTTKEEVS